MELNQVVEIKVFFENLSIQLNYANLFYVIDPLSLPHPLSNSVILAQLRGSPLCTRPITGTDLGS